MPSVVCSVAGWSLHIVCVPTVLSAKYTKEPFRVFHYPRAWRQHGSRDPDMFMPSLIIRAGDKAIFSPYSAQVWPEALGKPWRFHGFWVRPKAGETPRRQAVRRGSMGQPVRSTPNHARTAHHYPAGGRRNRNVYLSNYNCIFTQFRWRIRFFAAAKNLTEF